MKTFWKKTLAVLCALLLLSSPATAESYRWLDPVIDVLQGDFQSVRGEISVDIDAEAIRDFLSPLWDSLAFVQNTRLGMTEEEAEKMDAEIRQRIENVQRTVTAYASAIGALLNETTLHYASGDHLEKLDVLLSGEVILSFSFLQRPEENRVITFSDLFPSYGLEREFTDDADESALQFQRILSMLPEYADFNFLEEFFQASCQELDALKELGLAVQEGESLVYTEEKSAAMDRLSSLDIPYNPLYTQFLEMMRGDSSADDQTAEREDSEEIPFLLTMRRVGDEITEEALRTLEYKAYDEIKDPETGAVTRSSRDETWQEGRVFRYSPAFWEMTQYLSPSSSYRLIVRGEEEDTISGAVILCVDGEESRTDLTLRRTESGLVFTAVSSGNKNVLDQLYVPGDVPIALPPLQLTASANRSMTDFALELSVLEQEEWRPMATLHAAAEYLSSALEAPELENYTLLKPNRWGEYTDADYQQELQTVARPYLNRLVLTRLPLAARPLLTPLLTLVSLLGN